MKAIAVLDLRKRLGSVLDAVATRHEKIMIARANKPLAVLMPVQEYQEKVLGNERGRKLREVASKMDEWRRAHRRETAGVDVVKAVRRARKSR